MEAINLYMKAGLPARAARLALSIDVSNILSLMICIYHMLLTFCMLFTMDL